VIAKALVLGAVGTHVLAASAVSACPPGIDVHLDTPRGSPFVARPKQALSLKIKTTSKVTDIRATGALDASTIRRALRHTAVGSCLQRTSATATFRRRVPRHRVRRRAHARRVGRHVRPRHDRARALNRSRRRGVSSADARAVDQGVRAVVR
jgi:hypothetical protein